MSNTLLTPSVIGKEALMILQNNLVFGGLVHRDHAKEFIGAKVGDTISIRSPASFTAAEFTSTTSAQDATEAAISLELEKHFDVTFAVTSKELALSVEDFSAQLVEPAVVALAQAIDAYVASKYIEIPNYAGTAGDPPDTLADIAGVGKLLDTNKVPMKGRVAVIDPTAKADMFLVDAVARADARGDAGTALREASMGRVMGIDWYMDQNIKTHTAGTITTGLISKASTAVATGLKSVICTTAASTGECALLEGDIVLFAGDTQGYVLTAAATQASAATDVTLAFSPGLKVALTGSEAVTVIGNHAANMVFNKNAIALAVVPLEKPLGAKAAEYVQDRGMAIRVVYDYSTSTKTDTISLDVLVGSKVIHPELAARILG
ncbi:MAG: P22 coat protein [Acidobacteria bacterium]|nr:MAG: P22 coat protein [Acidobacteriota bacterium]